MWQRYSFLAHPGHPDFVTHDGGHALVVMLVLIAITVAAVGIYALSRRVILKSPASWNSSGTDARSGAKRDVTRS